MAFWKRLFPVPLPPCSAGRAPRTGTPLQVVSQALGISVDRAFALFELIDSGKRGVVSFRDVRGEGWTDRGSEITELCHSVIHLCQVQQSRRHVRRE